jgi:hypothetical protein
LQAQPPDPAKSINCGFGLTRSDAQGLADRIADFANLKKEEHPDR